MRDALKLAQDSNLDGFANVAQNGSYLPRYWSGKGFRACSARCSFTRTR